MTIVPRSPGGHVLDRRPGCAQRGEEVQFQRRLEIGVGEAQEPIRPDVRRADVVDQDVDPAEPLDGGIHQSCRATGFREIHGHRRDAIEGRQRVDRAGARHDRCPLLGERARRGQADALARSGYDRDLVSQFQIHVARTVQVARAPHRAADLPTPGEPATAAGGMAPGPARRSWCRRG